MRKVKIVNYKKFFRFIFIVGIILFILFRIPSFLHESKYEKTETDKEISNNVSTTIHMSVIGDVMSHSTNFKNAYDSAKKNYDFSNTFRNISSYIKNSDIAIGNLETTFA